MILVVIEGCLHSEKVFAYILQKLDVQRKYYKITSIFLLKFFEILMI